MHRIHTERLGTDHRAASRQLAEYARALEIGRASVDAYVAIGKPAPQLLFAAKTCEGSGFAVRTP